MSHLNKRKWTLTPGMAWLVPAAAAGLAVAMVISYVRSEAPPVAGGAPLYIQAAHEALEGTRNPQRIAQPVAAAIAALPAGLNPNDYYWCEKCKAYHPRQFGDNPQGVGNPGAIPATQPANAIPPLPSEFRAVDYYWCPDCKAYHPRQAPGDVPPAFLMAPETTPPPTPPVATPPAATPSVGTNS